MVSLFTEPFEKFSSSPPPFPKPPAKRRPRDGAELARREGGRSRVHRVWLTEKTATTRPLSS
eukprot:5170928-Pyramimonas_sp.AAC.1